MKSRYLKAEAEITNRIYRLLEDEDYDAIMAEKKYIRLYKSGWICTTYRLINTQVRLTIAELGSRYYYVKLLTGGVPQLAKETAGSAKNADAKGVDIWKFNSILADLYSMDNALESVENCDQFFQTAEN